MVAVGPPLEDTDLVVEPLHQAEADLVLLVTVRSDPVLARIIHDGSSRNREVA